MTDGVAHAIFIETTIANGGTTSAVKNLQGYSLVGVVTPAALTSTVVSFKALIPGTTTYVPVYDATNTLIDVDVATNEARYYALNPQDFCGIDNLQLVCGSAEGAARTFYLVVRPV
jgi:hypothetical protein